MVGLIACAMATLQGGAPVETGRVLAAAKTEVEGAQAWSFRISDKEGGHAFTCSFAVAPDLSAVYALAGPILRKVGLPDFKELLVLDLQRPTGKVWMSKAGVALHTSSPADPAKNHEIWILDPDTLAVKTRSAIEPGRPIGSAASTLAVCDVASTASAGDVVLIDLQAGKAGKPTPLEDLRKKGGTRVRDAKANPLRRFDPERAVVAPDGRTLLATDGDRIHRFRLSSSSLIYEDIGPSLQGVSALVVSPDSKTFLCLARGKSPRDSLTYVFKTGDLQKPAVEIPDIRPLAVDPASGRIYGYVGETAVIAFSPSGKREKEYRLPLPKQQASAWMHPQGGKLLVVSYEEREPALWIELGN